MIITLPWLKKHLKTKANQDELIDKLTNIGCLLYTSPSPRD